MSWHIYIPQALHAIGMAMNLSVWTALYTGHIDKGKQSAQRGISAVFVGIGGALAAFIGGWAATNFGFDIFFARVGLLGFSGAAALLFIRREIEKGAGHGLYFSLKELIQKGSARDT